MNEHKLDRHNLSNIINLTEKKENKYEKSLRNIKEGYLSKHVKDVIKKVIKKN